MYKKTTFSVSVDTNILIRLLFFTGRVSKNLMNKIKTK